MATSTKTPQAEQFKKARPKNGRLRLLHPKAKLPGPELVQLALADPTAVSPSVILALQRSHGNRAIQRLLAHTSRAESESTAVTNSPVQYTQPSASPRTIIQPKPVGSQTEPPLQPEPVLELNGLSSGFVPPVAPPATPPPNGNKDHRVGSPYRHLDGVSNRKIQTKLTIGPARDRDEHQADVVTDRVMRTPEPTQVVHQGAAKPNKVQRKANDNGNGPPSTFGGQ